MQLDISKNYFYEVSGIVGIKAHIEKINKLEINESYAKGEIEVNLSYSDNEGMECFKVINFPFEIILDELKVIDVILTNVSVTLIEGQGVDINYSLIVNYLVLEEEKVVEVETINDVLEEEKVVEVEPINDALEEEKVVEVEPINDVLEEEKSLEKIKDDISKDYEEKLLDKLNERNDETIITKTHLSIDNFLDFFDKECSEKFSLKTLHVEKEEDLNKISKEYNVSMDVLLSGYDRVNHKVMFKIVK